MSNNDVLHKAIETYVKDAQLDMCVEEMSELTKEICKTKSSMKYMIKKLVG